MLLFSTTAGATVGGPRTVEALGYEPASGVVWFLEHDGSEAGEPPRAFRIATRATPPRMPETAPQGPPDDLAPLVELPATEATLDLRCESPGDARGHLRGDHLVERPVRLTIVRGCDARVRELYVVPGSTDAIAIVRYVGVDVEAGYHRDRPVLVRYRPPSGRVGAARAGGQGVRVRIEAPIHEPTGHVSALELVVIDPTGQTHRVEVARMPGACSVLGPADVCCGGVRFETTVRGRVVEILRDKVAVARAHLPAGTAAEPPAFAFAREALRDDEGEVRAVCAADRDCRVVIGADTAVFEPMRGTLACERAGSEVRCTYTHATHHHIQRRWVVDLATREARGEPPPR